MSRVTWSVEGGETGATKNFGFSTSLHTTCRADSIGCAAGWGADSLRDVASVFIICSLMKWKWVAQKPIGPLVNGNKAPEFSIHLIQSSAMPVAERLQFRFTFISNGFQLNNVLFFAFSKPFSRSNRFLLQFRFQIFSLTFKQTISTQLNVKCRRRKWASVQGAYCSRKASIYRMASLFISMVTARFSLLKNKWWNSARCMS